MEDTLMVGCVATFISILLEKGFGLVVGGFMPNPFEKVTEYWPTFSEMLINVGIWALGALLLTFLYKIALGVKAEVE
jgi:molybdopterin-containing oxidoreductase family membrane subunit